MPIYEYEHEGDPDAGCAARFEVFARMSDAALEKCPKCGRPCRRVLSTFGVAENGAKGLLSKSNLESHGFTQYVRKGKGYYEKSAGVGPKAISDGS